MNDDVHARNTLRWRLILGDEAESMLRECQGEWALRDRMLEYLYGRER